MTFPSITPTDISFSSVNPTRITRTLNGIEQRGASAGQYFTITATFDSLNESEQRQIYGYIKSKSGPLDAFLFTLPDYIGDSTGSYTGGIAVSGSTAPIGATSITVNTTGSVFPSLKQGDLISFANHTKVYTITSDVNTPGTTISFYPALRAAVPATTVVNHKNVQVWVRFASDNLEFRVGTNNYGTFTLDFVEVLQ